MSEKPLEAWKLFLKRFKKLFRSSRYDFRDIIVKRKDNF